MKNISICILLFSLDLANSVYDVGDIINETNQQQAFSICNGDYYYNSLKLADFNGLLNGGHFFVTFFDVSATW